MLGGTPKIAAPTAGLEGVSKQEGDGKAKMRERGPDMGRN